MTDNPTKNGHKGRNKNGQFVKGGPGGPGRPRGSHQHFKELMLATISDKRFIELVDKVIAAADNSEQWALKELLDRLMGKPSQPIEGAMGVFAMEPTEEDVARATDIIGRRLKYGRSPADR